jgi:hypothetical protein
MFHCVKNGIDECIIKNIRANDISNATYTSNNRQGFIKVVLSQLRDFIEGQVYQFQEEGSDWRFDESHLFTSDSGSTSPCMHLLEASEDA